MAPRPRSMLQVLMNGKLVGRLSSSVRGTLHFAYDSSWLAFPHKRPISLSMPLSQREYSGGVVEHFFDNLLPDSQPIRNRLQALVGANSTRCFDLLSHIGRDCVGALQLLPEGTEVDVHSVKATPLSEEEIGKVLSSYGTMPLGIDPQADFRLSLAGAQEKTAFLFYNNLWHRPHGSTPTSHLFKLPIGELAQSGIDLRESIENEWLCHQLLASFGLPVAHSTMETFAGHKVLVVSRFDRRWSSDSSWLIRLPQEDMCQASGISGNLKYQADGGPGMIDIMDILLGSSASYGDRTTFMKAQFLFWLLGAIDGHAKNFSIFHLPGPTYRLTPLYDVISIYPVVAAGQLDRQRVKMAMAVHGRNRHFRWDTITHRHWLEMAGKCRFPPEDMKLLIEECCDGANTIIENVSNLLPPHYPEAMASAIFNGIGAARDRMLCGSDS